MRITYRLLALVLVLSLGIPAAALAQSAGDEQYSDPFQEESSNQNGQADQGADTPAQEDPQPTEVAPAQDSQPSDSAAPGAQALPHTGLPALWIALSGAALLGAGIGLRRTA